MDALDDIIKFAFKTIIVITKIENIQDPYCFTEYFDDVAPISSRCKEHLDIVSCCELEGLSRHIRIFVDLVGHTDNRNFGSVFPEFLVPVCEVSVSYLKRDLVKKPNLAH